MDCHVCNGKGNIDDHRGKMICGRCQGSGISPQYRLEGNGKRGLDMFQKQLPHIAAIFFFIVAIYSGFVYSTIEPANVMQQIVQMQVATLIELGLIGAFLMECIWWLGERLGSGDAAARK